MYVLKLLWHQNSIKSSQGHEDFIEIRLNFDRAPPSKAPASLSAYPLKFPLIELFDILPPLLICHKL